MKTLPLSQLTTPVLIDKAQAQEFQKKGYTLTPAGLTADEVLLYRRTLNKAAYWYYTEKNSLKERDIYGKAFLQIMNLWEADETVRTFTLTKAASAHNPSVL